MEFTYADIWIGLVAPLKALQAVRESKYWKAVAASGWCDSADEQDPVKKNLIDFLNKEDASDFRDFVQAAVHVLGLRVEKWERESSQKIYLSDDGFSDLLSHIVGLGKEEYEKVLRDPLFAWKRYERGHAAVGGYQESFLYCLPDEEHYG